MAEFQVYQDLAERTGGEFYLGVCGPVRTGKSTFIKRFMDLLVIPGIMDDHDRERATDELPQSAAGKTIMTTEPKFIPKEAAQVKLFGDNPVKIRLIDCVGYIVKGAEGLMEEENERMVMTPWSDQPMPFTQAAEFGTRKVIHDHSTIGIVVT
ncbi:MAG: stage IV sporulation protein A, partial [Lachnospiraceae bacterium]|nr:stage IV sporulation protein A [Lachnospiraceae bacterium]